MWSYSRINSFGDCPYAWFLKYIKLLPSVPNFYSEYGKFMHSILQKYYLGELQAYDLPGYFISEFTTVVKLRPQKSSTYANYFMDGLKYLRGIKPSPLKVLGVEQFVEFDIAGVPACGFIDLVESDGGITITDHKSADIKPKSARKKPTIADQRLDDMFRQLYLYSLAVYEQYGEYPKTLRFNAFRKGLSVQESFSADRLANVVSWAKNQIETITYNTNWHPHIDYFRCNILCDMRENCEYYLINKGR